MVPGEPVPSRLRASAFLALGGLAVAGTIIGQLGATSATTLASDGNGGLETGIFLSVMLAFAGIGTMSVNRLTSRWGRLRVFAVAQAGVAVAWAIVGLIEMFTTSSLLVLWLSAPLFGVLSGITVVLTPFIARQFIDPSSLATSLARRGVAVGIATILGASLGGYIIHRTDPGVGILANGVLTMPLAILLLRSSHQSIDVTAVAKSPKVRELVAALWSNTTLRHFAVLTVFSMVIMIPMFNMVVPLLNSIDHDPLPSGAGLMLAGIAGGRLLVPTIVKRILRRQTELGGALWASIGVTSCMLIFAATTAIPFTQVDLVVWTIIGICLGASRFTLRTLTIAGVAHSAAPGGEQSGVAGIALLATISLPIGTLLWGLSLDYLAATATVAISALTMTAVVGGLAFTVRRNRRAASGI